MNKIYITAHFSGADNKSEIEALCALIRSTGFEDFCFIRDVEKYQKMFNNPRDLMKRALEEIAKCDSLFIDFDGPGTGRIVELGMAYTLRKKIIIVTKKGTVVRDTIKGLADVFYEYEKIDDIVPILREYIASN